MPGIGRATGPVSVLGNPASEWAVRNDGSSRGCRLCRRAEGQPFHDERRRYYRCPNCGLVFADPAFHLDAERERGVYDQHRNSPDDPAYRHFLSRLFEAVCDRIEAGSVGLDFGSGPGPTLSVMFEEAGHQVSLFDPFYAPVPTVFDREYDFITASEVVEHLHWPGVELDRLWRCLVPGGVLGVMTKRVLDRARFSTWHYKNDPTHVCFFALQTFEWLADHWGADLEVAADDVVLLLK